VDVRRRDFILALGGGALWFRAARAQSTSPVVGVLEGSTEEAAHRAFALSQARLAELGYVEGRNLAIEYRWANYRMRRAPRNAKWRASPRCIGPIVQSRGGGGVRQRRCCRRRLSRGYFHQEATPIPAGNNPRFRVGPRLAS
jgi:hypothetical protein